jgi:hypothetical protein
MVRVMTEKALCLSDTSMQPLDVVLYQGRRWIVPEWIESLETGGLRPIRLICLETLVYQERPDQPIRYLLTFPIPMSVRDGTDQSPAYSDYEVIEGPDIDGPIEGLTREL